jgi:hypothetical protein
MSSTDSPPASEDIAAGEAVPPEEAAAIATIAASIEDQVRAAALTGPARRDAHPKAHGCVQAEFEVLGGLPPELGVGLFSVPRTYKAWIRFSNGNAKPQPDSVGDGRGMAVKLMGVAESPSTTQDFIMINSPAFFVRNAADYVDFQLASNPLGFFFPSFNPFRFRLHELMMALAITRQKVLNPLNARYWSMTPVLFGDVACKYSARPAGAPSPFTATDTADFLRANLARHLSQQGAAFDFMIQRRTRPDAMPVEDPTVAWDEQAAPFTPVARITIPPQSFEAPQQLANCENLSFTPWHCALAHRPLGGINRVRRVVYEAISSLRHQLNHAPRAEPTDFTL